MCELCDVLKCVSGVCVREMCVVRDGGVDGGVDVCLMLLMCGREEIV